MHPIDLPAPTHEVTNQAPPFGDVNLYATDRALAEAVAREGAGWAEAQLSSFGALLGRAETLEQGRLANAWPPVLKAFDRHGRRVELVEFHPAYHHLLGLAVAEGLHSGPWADPRPGAHVARAAGVVMLCQVEAGVQCPTTMTYGSVPAIRREPELARDWLPPILSTRYDPRSRPVAAKTGAMVGMGMTEKQGGSDLRGTTTRATPVAGDPAIHHLVGHKWFLSAPMSDAFLILAQAPEGLTCFLVPRLLPDGRLNGLELQRLKDKLGNRSNASSEVEIRSALGWRLGAPGRGVATIIEMGTYTRLDCALGSAGLMRAGLAQAIHHATHRRAFGQALADQPLMTNVLADLALESEASTALALRLARAFDRQDDAAEAAFRRLVTPAAKYVLCKRAPVLIAEAMEVLGGNGYVEDSGLPRLYREAPVNSIWEGSGNIMALDLLRAIARSPDSVAAVQDELAPARGGDRALDGLIQSLPARLQSNEPAEHGARRAAEALVTALEAALLMRFAPTKVAEAFCASRLGERAASFGCLPPGLDCGAIIERARPA